MRTPPSILLTVLCGLLTASCSHPSDPGRAAPTPDAKSGLIALLANVSTPDESRLAADRKLAATAGPTDDTRLAVLEQIVWSPGQSDALRIYALDQLAAADPNRAGRVLALYLPRLDPGPVLQHACRLAVKLADLRTLDALIRSLVRPTKLWPRTDRPEAAALTVLTGQKLEDLLAERLLHATDVAVRVAALDLLVELRGAAPVKSLLRDARADRLVADLQWWLGLFETLPAGPQEMAWVLQLARAPQDPRIQAAAEAHRKLAGEKDYTFAPRLVGVLAELHRRPAGYQETRETLLAALRTDLAARQHIRRATSYPQAPHDGDDALAGNAAKLSRGDLWALRLLCEALARPDFRRAVLEAGLADMSDTTTEHGGLIALTDAPGGPRGAVLEVHPPLYAEHDRTYISSEKLLQDLPLALAAFHLHFQQVHNEEHAGPGQGDLEFARTRRSHGVVFTSVGKGRFDAAFYTPAGAVVDLGIYAAE